MSCEKIFSGFECVFSKANDVLLFFNSFNLKLNRYYFYTVDAAVYSYNKRLDVPRKFLCSYFQELVQSCFWGEGLVLHLYPESAEFQKIDNYDDFLNSECQMIILLYDVCYLEIYCKNQEWLQILMQKAIDIPGACVEGKSKDTDSRTMMYV